MRQSRHRTLVGDTFLRLRQQRHALKRKRKGRVSWLLHESGRVWTLTDRLPRTAPASTAARLDAILEEISPIGMARTRVEIGL
jgi:hypothetical protein